MVTTLWRKRIVFVGLLCAAAPVIAQNTHALSADGRFAAYAREDALWLLPVRRGAVPGKIADVATYFTVPRWAPQGNRLAYYSTRSGTLQLWLYDLRSGRRRRISFVEGGISPGSSATFGGWINDVLRYSWSPDGRRIAFTSAVIDPRAGSKASEPPAFPSADRLGNGEPIVLTNTTPAAWTLYGLVSYAHPASTTFNDVSVVRADVPRLLPAMTTQLFVLDVETTKATQLTHDSAGYFTPEWSPDGKRIAYMSAGTSVIYRLGTEETHIFVRDLESARDLKITQGRTQKTLPHWSPDGKWIAYFESDITKRFVRDNGICLIGADGRRQRRISNALDRLVIDYGWSADGSGIFLTYRDGLMTPFIRLDPSTGESALISPAQAVVDGFASSRGGVLWTQLTDPNGPTTLELANSRGRARRLQILEPAATDRAAQILRWANRRGESIEGVLIYPADYQKHRRYPVIVDAYSWQTMDLSGFRQSELFRATGDYVVFRPNHRAPHMWINGMKSPRYDAAAIGSDGVDVMADDIMSGLEALSRRIDIDRDRACLFGFSNGGVQAEQLLTKTHRFKCAVLQSPSVSDWLSTFFLTTDDAEMIRWMYGISPWEDTSVYTALSPVYNADKIHTPILMATGDREASVLPTIEMYNALRFLKKDVTLLRYASQGHGFSGAASKDFEERIRRFFAAYLGGST